MRSILVLVALAATASAEPEQPRAVFGYQLGLGMLPIDRRATETVSIGLSADHAVAPRWSLFGEYEWIWMFRAKTSTMADEHGDGQRAQVGVRRRLGERPWHELAFFVDAEVGGGFMLASDNTSGLHAIPDAFAGLRTGYDFHAAGTRRTTSSMLVCEAFLRVLAVPGGAGGAGGVAFSWQ